MKKGIHSLYFLIGSALLSLLLLGGCSSTPQSGPQPGTGVQTVNFDASWARIYHSFKDLKHDADVVVQGTVTRVIRTEAASPAQKTPYPSTDFLFTVSRVIQDRANYLKVNTHIVGPLSITLTLHQTGGLVNNVKYQINDDPLFQQGEQYVLFLHQYKPGFYNVIGGPSGRFVVQGGMIKPINTDGVPFSGSQDEFMAQVQKS